MKEYEIMFLSGFILTIAGIWTLPAIFFSLHIGDVIVFISSLFMVFYCHGFGWYFMRKSFKIKNKIGDKHD